MPSTAPEIIKAADNAIDQLRSNADEVRNFTITFLTLLVYINIVISTTTHEHLLKNTSIKLPFLDVNAPVEGFYALVPWALLVSHIYILLQHYLLAQQIYQCNEVLKRLSSFDKKSAVAKLGSLPFLHWKLGDHDRLTKLVIIIFTITTLILWPLGTLWWLQATYLPSHSAKIVLWQQLAITFDVIALAWLWPKTLDSKDSCGRWWFGIFWDGIITSGKKVFSLVFWIEVISIVFSNVFWRGVVDIAFSRTFWVRMFNIVFSWKVWKILFSSMFSIRAFSILCLLFSLMTTWFVSVLPGSPIEQFMCYKEQWWCKSVGFAKPRLVFWPTAWLHEMHIVPYKEGDEIKQIYGAVLMCSKNDCVQHKPLLSSIQGDGTIFVCEVGSKLELQIRSESNCLLHLPSQFPRNFIVQNQLITTNELPAKTWWHLKRGGFDDELIYIEEALGVDLNGRDLRYANFSNSSFPNALMNQADISEADLHDVNFEKVSARHTKFDNSNFDDAIVYLSDFEASNFSNASFKEARLVQSRFNGANLNRTVLDGANFSGAYLINASLINASINATRFKGSQMMGAKLHFAKFDKENDLSFADLTGAEAYGVTFDKSNLQSAEFKWIRLSGAQFINSKVTGTVFIGVDSAVITNEEKIEEITNQFSQAGFSPDTNNYIKNEKVNAFRNRIRKSVNFDPKNTTLECLSDASGPPNCKYQVSKLVNNEKERNDAFWELTRQRRDFLCNDQPDKYWVSPTLFGIIESNLSREYTNIEDHSDLMGSYNMFLVERWLYEAQQIVRQKDTCSIFSLRPKGSSKFFEINTNELNEMFKKAKEGTEEKKLPASAPSKAFPGIG